MDQIIIVLKDNNIHQEALKKSWDFKTLRKKAWKLR